jgi:hypothetical protein
MASTLDFLKAMQDLEDQALQSLRKRAELSDETTKAFTEKVAAMMERFNVPCTTDSETGSQKPAAIDGILLQGSSGDTTAQPQQSDAVQ